VLDRLPSRATAKKVPKKKIMSAASKKAADRAAKMAKMMDKHMDKEFGHVSEQEKRKRELEEQMATMNISQEMKEQMKAKLAAQEEEATKVRRKKMSMADFETLTIIGRGAFGEVRVCRKKDNQEVFAMKMMKKTDMLKKNQVEHIRSERNVLALANNPWVVKLHYSFQDQVNLYLAMEYLAGGDLMTILMKYDILTEAQTRFYIAETALAIQSVHRLNYVHRDLKPDNILLDNKGHVKLSDFGLCKAFDAAPMPYLEQYKEEAKRGGQGPTNDHKGSRSDKKKDWKKRSRKLAFSTVGTPDYIAPEVFAQTGYGQECDWWSLGVIMYECLVGYPPFYAEDPMSTCRKIVNWKKTLVFPEEANLSPAAKALISQLITDSSKRLNYEQLQRHPFFKGLDWTNMRSKTAAIVPKLTSDVDTRHFDKFEAQDVPDEAVPEGDATFVGYTFKREEKRAPINASFFDAPE
jgi:serine/threonine kinase 38